MGYKIIIPTADELIPLMHKNNGMIVKRLQLLINSHK
jgi:hypothetical protein